MTDRIRLGTGICLVPQRNPVYTAKQVVDLDALSGGRADFGIGVGWLREEFEAVGALRPSWARTDEYLAVMKTLWQDEVSEHRGELYDLAPAACTRQCSNRIRRSTWVARAMPPSGGSPPTARVGTRSTGSPSNSTSPWAGSTASSASTVAPAPTSS